MGIATTVVTRGENVFNRTQVSRLMRFASRRMLMPSDQLQHRYCLGKYLHHRPQIPAYLQPGVCIFTHVWLTATILFGLFRSRSLSQRANRLLTRVLM